MITESPSPNKSNIQGLILHGYTHPCSVHLMFKFANAKNVVPAFFKVLLPYLRSAENWGDTKPEMMLNIGLTWNGIKALRPDLNPNIFPPDFVVGPQGPANPNLTPNPQVSLNDTGASIPSNWWNKRFPTSDIHCVVHAYAMNYDAQDKIVEIITSAAAKSNGFISELFPLDSNSGRLEQYPFLPNNTIHFGYLDSIDEPGLKPDPTKPGQTDLNNFLIGYPPVTIPGPTTGPEGLFAKDGCYNAFRILHQDAVTFENFLEKQAEIIAPQIGKPKEYTKEWLAAKLNGRWRNGSPTVLSPDMPDQKTVYDTDFTFEDDPKAFKCPFSAHTRVTNPRDSKILPPGSEVPHLIRRGVPYGAPLNDKNAAEDRGLIGMFLCGDLASQFQKLYNWINFNDFSPYNIFPVPQKTQEALIANRTPANSKIKIDTSFTIPMGEGKEPIRIQELPQFVVTRGTAYCLLPSIATIKDIAGVK